ncbi:MAG: M20/M25/M40 family metallo-hydrolase [Bacteroidales bacterium]|nr:M20/M25/M40 family metallo-hydrolase [Bacteroidales bacterium]MDT8373110.1 M20/M25/M40 family metallo-hydrolase [Bacteroidales bacterium]
MKIFFKPLITRLLIVSALLCATVPALSQKADTVLPKPGYETAVLLSEYISHASVSGTEKYAGEFLAGVCRERGLHLRIFTDTVDSYNFAASLYPLDSGKPNIIFLNHIDVVTPGEESGWKYPAFSGTIVEDTVWGRGAIDMKQAVIMQLMALSTMVDRAAAEDLPMNVTLLCVSGEETYGLNGSKIISERYLPELNPAVLIGEGGIGSREVLTGDPQRPVFAISLSEKRALWLRLHLAYESSGHGSVPPPDYASKLMISSLNSLTEIRPQIRFDDLSKLMFRNLGKLEGGLTGFLISHPVLFKPLVAGGLRKNPLMASTVTNTVTITHLATTECGINQIPQEITAFLDCRLLPGTSTTHFLSYLWQKLDNSHIELSVIEETQGSDSTVPDRYYSLLAESIEDVYPDAGVVPVLFPATSDNNYFRNAGVPVYGVIPVLISQQLLETIHNYNERIPVEALHYGTEVYRLFLEKSMPDTDQP